MRIIKMSALQLHKMRFLDNKRSTCCKRNITIVGGFAESGPLIYLFVSVGQWAGPVSKGHVTYIQAVLLPKFCNKHRRIRLCTQMFIFMTKLLQKYVY